MFALFGNAAPDLWLVVARAGAVMAVVMVFKLCVRITCQLAGPRAARPVASRSPPPGPPPLLAGVIAAVGLVTVGRLRRDNALGYSEGLMIALVLIAVERHLDGAPPPGVRASASSAALDRPEIWLFWGPTACGCAGRTRARAGW